MNARTHSHRITRGDRVRVEAQHAILRGVKTRKVLVTPESNKNHKPQWDECDQFWQSAELRPGQALLKLNRVVTVDQFLRIMTVLGETESDDR